MSSQPKEKMMTMIKGVYIGIGAISLGIGIIGIVVPLLPTTPFLLLSAACYAKGSKRLYQWFINIRWIGNALKKYHEGQGMSINGKIVSVLLLWATIILSALVIGKLLYQILLFIVALVVTIHIIMIRTYRVADEDDS